jgi:hypothetical protein
MNEEKRLPDPNRPANNPTYPHLKVREKTFRTPEELEEKIEDFFSFCNNFCEETMSASGAIKLIKRPLIPTVNGLAAHLKISVECLHDYGADERHKDYHSVVKMAKERILAYKTMGLVNGKGSTQGLIFDLKNNHGWKEKVETDNKNEHIIKVEFE